MKCGRLVVTQRDGVWVTYSNPRSLTGMACLLVRVLRRNLLPNGRSVMLYGTGASNFNRCPFLQDWAALFELLGAAQIWPIIAARFPLLGAAEANAFLESGQVIDTIVLLAAGSSQAQVSETGPPNKRIQPTCSRAAS